MKAGNKKSARGKCDLLMTFSSLNSFILSFPRRRESSQNMKNYYVYIMASQRNGTLYIGVTNDLVKRIHQHKSDIIDGFTKKHGVHRLVYYEHTEAAESAIRREKQLKKWNRKWKLRLIEKSNPEWNDLYDELF